MSKFYKSLKVFVSMILCLTILFSCAQRPPEEVGKPTPGITDPQKVVGGERNYEVEATNKMILNENQTKYKVLLPEKPSTYELFAANELCDVFFEATGVRLDIVYKTKDDNTENYFSIGETSLKKSKNNFFDNKKLGPSGFRIITADNNIILAGSPNEYGSLYAVYQFLNMVLNFEVYDEFIYSLNRGVSNIELMDYNIIDVPDIPIRSWNYGYLRQNEKLALRLRMEKYDDRFVNFAGAAHNSMRIITKDEYYEDHKEWFSDSTGTQLSYTAQGNEEELELLITTVAEKMKAALIKDLSKTNIAFTHEDVPIWCEHKATTDEESKYGTKVASVIKFTNRVRYKIDEWFESEEGAPYKRDLIIYFFAYSQTIEPPVKWDESQSKYVPIDEEVVCAPGVAPWIAPIRADHTKSYYHEDNVSTRETLAGWQALSKDVIMWTYNTNFNYYLAPYDSFGSIAGVYKAAVENKAYILFDQGQANNNAQPTGWSKLKVYLSSKLSWDVNADIEKLTENFFKYYFGEAKDDMLKWFREYRLHSEILKANSGYSGASSIYKVLLKQEFWPKNLLEQWRSYAQAGLEKIKYLKNEDPVRYNVLSNNIKLERLSIDYLCLGLYRDSGMFTAEERQARMDEFYNDMLYFNIHLLSELVEINELYRQFGFI